MQRRDSRFGPLFRVCLVTVSWWTVALCVASCRPGPKAPTHTPRHLLLVTVDTLRADHVLASVHGEPLSPALEKLGSRGMVFSQAYSTASMTSPGVTSILTGLLPHRSGVIQNRNLLQTPLRTLAEIARENRFKTAAFVANPVLRGGFGFESGFDTYSYVSPTTAEPKTGAHQIIGPAFEWFQRHDQAGDRCLVWIHLMEPHGPYVPPVVDRERFPVGVFGSPRRVALLPRGDNSGRGGIPFYQYAALHPPSQDPRDYLARYCGEVRAVDRQIDEMVQGLRSAELMGSTAIILTSDHGEALEDDHGFYFSHSNPLTEDQIRVPLMIFGAGVTIPETLELPVSTVDVLPTALDLLGLEDPGGHDGVSVLQPDTERPVCAVSVGQAVLRHNGWKLVLDRRRGERRLFDVGRDPDEQVDLADQRVEVVADLSAILETVLLRPVVVRPQVRHHLIPQEEDELRALGYVQ